MVGIWDMKKSKQDLVFDTTASNSGVGQGACKRMDAVAGLVSLCS